jgi:hypothetical protein
MSTRLLIMFSVVVLELAGGISAIVGVVGQYQFGIDSAGIAGIVMIVAVTIVALLVTIAVTFGRKSAARADRIIEDARKEAARILEEATEKALALSGMDGGRCRQCGNPRTGRFCPKCGVAGESRAA